MLVAIIDTGIQPDIFPIGPIMYDMEVTRFGRLKRSMTEEVFSGSRLQQSCCHFDGVMA